MSQELLEVRDLKVHFHTRRGVVKAVDGITFSIQRGKTLGLVGESGCGKTISCLSIIGLLPEAARIISGRVLFEGEDLVGKPERELARYRGRKIAIILQDPMTSLDPVFTVGDQIAETLRAHGFALRDGTDMRAVQLLKDVRISSPETRIKSYPHQMSGGMRQRVAGAISLSCQPSLLIADEPTTALDTITQVQYLALLKELQGSMGFSLLLVTHDFGIVAETCDYVAVMYAGRIVEQGSVHDVFDNPLHPYTRGLLLALPRLDASVDRLATIAGEPPDLSSLPAGCAFVPRCQHATDVCKAGAPSAKSVGGGHSFSCWLTEA